MISYHWFDIPPASCGNSVIAYVLDEKYIKLHIINGVNVIQGINLVKIWKNLKMPNLTICWPSSTLNVLFGGPFFKHKEKAAAKYGLSFRLTDHIRQGLGTVHVHVSTHYLATTTEKAIRATASWPGLTCRVVICLSRTWHCNTGGWETI